VATTEPTVLGHNYFPSTVEQEDEYAAEKRAQILTDAISFKRLAADYAHPEIHVSTTEPAAFGRNYFPGHLHLSRRMRVNQKNSFPTVDYWQ